MKKLMLTILMVLITLVGANASTFKSSALTRHITIATDNPKSFINPSFVVNERTSFQLRKFDITSITFDRMLRMAGNKTLCQDPFDNAVKETKELSKRIKAAKAKLEEYKIPNIKTSK